MASPIDAARELAEEAAKAQKKIDEDKAHRTRTLTVRCHRLPISMEEVWLQVLPYLGSALIAYSGAHVLPYGIGALRSRSAWRMPIRARNFPCTRQVSFNTGILIIQLNVSVTL